MKFYVKEKLIAEIVLEMLNVAMTLIFQILIIQKKTQKSARENME